MAIYYKCPRCSNRVKSGTDRCTYCGYSLAENGEGSEGTLGSPTETVEDRASRFEDQEPDFDGETYDPPIDHKRLTTQLGRVRQVLLAASRSGVWYTLRDLSDECNAPEASISARIRDLRKSKFGGYKVDHRRKDRRGTWEYQIRRIDEEVITDIHRRL